MSTPPSDNLLQGHGLRVLIVDDEAAHRRLVHEILEEPDFEVAEADHGARALEIIARGGIDVVLLDNNLPGMSGLDVCRHLRAQTQHRLLPIIMVTGRNSVEDLASSLAAGATDFIAKPYTQIELIARVNAAGRQKLQTDQLDHAESVLFAVANMVETRDEGTGEHCQRLMHNSVAFGEALGLAREDLDALRKGGVLHDIGKIGIPDAILLKKSGLTDEEFTIMKTHTVIGAQLCSGLVTMRRTADIVRHHHERWDGSGYPDRLQGEQIPLVARVFQIVDIFDALVAVRPYKKAFPVAQALDMIEQEVARGWREPRLVAEFVNLVRTRPERLYLPSPEHNPPVRDAGPAV